MGFALSPGVNVTEIDLTGFIPAVATTGGAFVGQFEWGPVEDYVLLGNRKKLENWFGKPDDENYRDWFSCSNFLSYGNNLNVVRVVEASALNSTADGLGLLIKNETEHGIALDTVGGAPDAAQIVAKYPGILGNSLKVEMADALSFEGWDYAYLFDLAPGTSDFAADVGGVNDELHIVVLDEDGEFTGRPGAILEKFAFVSKASNAKRLDGEPSFYGSILNTQSQYVWFTGIPVAPAYAVGGSITAVTVTAGGQDYVAVPVVGFTGDGTGAAGTAVLASTGGVKSVALNAAGTGYTDGDVLLLTTADGSGAQVTVTGETGGVIDTVDVTAAGTLISADEVGVVVTGGTGTGATFDTTIGFAVASVTIDVAGADYTSAPVVDFTGDGTGATATAVSAPDYDDAWDQKAALKNFQSLSVPLVQSLSGGDKGGAVTSDELIPGWAMFQNSEVVDVSLLFTGDAGGDTEHQVVNRWVVDNVAEFRKDCVLFFSPKFSDVVNQPEAAATENAIATRNAINTVSSYAIMDSGWKYQYDPFNDKYRWIPLNADIAGLAARTDDVTDPWYSIAGFARGQIKNVIQLALNPSQTYRDELYKNGINPVVSFAGEGVLLYGDKTQLAKPSAFQKINIRRLFIVLEKAIATAAKYQLFEFNDAFTRAQFKNQVEPFLREVRGRRGIQDFRVVCDETNNTPEVVDRSEFVADIYIKPAYSINFIQLNFIAVRSGVEFDEIIGVSSVEQGLSI